LASIIEKLALSTIIEPLRTNFVQGAMPQSAGNGNPGAAPIASLCSICELFLSLPSPPPVSPPPPSPPQHPRTVGAVDRVAHTPSPCAFGAHALGVRCVGRRLHPLRHPLARRVGRVHQRRWVGRALLVRSDGRATVRRYGRCVVYAACCASQTGVTQHT